MQQKQKKKIWTDPVDIWKNMGYLKLFLLVSFYKLVLEVFNILIMAYHKL